MLVSNTSFWKGRVDFLLLVYFPAEVKLHGRIIMKGELHSGKKSLGKNIPIAFVFFSA